MPTPWNDRSKRKVYPVTETNAETKGREPLSALSTIALHLLPGVLVVGFDLIAAPIVERIGMPPHFTLILGNAIILVTFELGYLLWQGKQASGTLSLREAILYREPMPVWQYVVLILPLVVWALGAIVLLSPVGAGLRETAFSWMPALFRAVGAPPDTTLYSEPALVVTALFLFVFTGVLIPVVEELYYRGHLMARMSRLGWWAPVVSTALWSLNHLWQPWDILSFFLGFLPVVFAVQWKRNAYISLAVHTIGNALNAFLLVGALLGLAP
jgi:membrane protease YdiL (CAAX protease family)